MACSKCVVKADIDGQSTLVRLLWNSLDEVATDKERVAVLSKCRYCDAYWESYGYEPSVKELNVDQVAIQWPNLTI